MAILGMLRFLFRKSAARRVRRLCAEGLEQRYLLAADFGDAPLPFPVTSGENGASHEAVGVQLGATRDAEADGAHSTDANGDGSDEDGVTPEPLAVSQLGRTLTIDVSNVGAAAHLDAWIDFDGDGSWGGLSEQIADTLPVVEGSNLLQIDVPPWSQPGPVAARFRVSATGNAGVGGSVADGEVEDYLFTLDPVVNSAVGFDPREAVGGALGARDVTTADLDGDGDLDVLAASSTSDKIIWYRNDGVQNFVPRTVASSLDGARAVIAADVNGDGHMDVLSASSGDHRILWHENNGNQQFTTRTISDTATIAFDIAVADLDLDGDLDVVSAWAGADTVAWHENDGQQNFSLHTIASDALGAAAVSTADIDRDGDMDILAASPFDDTVAWYENDGAQSFTKHVVVNDADFVVGVLAADLDGDGDRDIVSASAFDDTIAWHENDGSQGFTRRNITTTADFAIGLFAADMNGDGRMDVLAASRDDDSIAWFENLGNGNFLGQTISTAADGPLAVAAADLDSDGDMDVLSASSLDGRVDWYANAAISVVPEKDFGDAPAGYATTNAENGAAHRVAGPYLGSARDWEEDGQHSQLADADDNNGSPDDEDGLVFGTTILAVSNTATTSSIEVTASAAGRIDAWVDFNNDGDWFDADERVITSAPVVAGPNFLSIVVPPGVSLTNAVGRFRISLAGGLTPIGLAGNGEVEDHFVPLTIGDQGAAIQVKLPPGFSQLLPDGNDIVAAAGSTTLFRAEATHVTSLLATASNQDDEIEWGAFPDSIADTLSVAGGAGEDVLRLAGSNRLLDLTAHADTQFRDLERIDIRGTGANTLVLDQQEVLNLSSSSNTVLVEADGDDVVTLGAGWVLAGSEIINQRTYLRYTQGAAELLIRDRAPTSIELNPSVVDELSPDETVVGQLTAVDPDALDTFTFSLINDAGGRFQIAGTAVQVAAGSLLDFETDPAPQITVRVTDRGGLAYETTVSIQLRDVNEPPSEITLSNATVEESAAAGDLVGHVAAVDPDAGDAVGFQLADDARGRFAVNGTRLEVADATGIDFESNATHVIVLRAIDAGGLTLETPFTITVIDQTDPPTDIQLTPNQVDENAAADKLVGALTATDLDSTQFTYALTEDAGGRFLLEDDRLKVAAGAVLDYESNSQHAVGVRVTDDTNLTFEKVLTVEVNDVNEPPTEITLDPSVVDHTAESGTVVGTLSGNDPDAGDLVVFELVDDSSGRFALSGSDITVVDPGLLDFEALPTYDIIVKGTDLAGLHHQNSITITLTRQNDPPSAPTLTPANVPENAENDLLIGQVTSSDPNPGDLVTLLLLDNAGGRFQLVDGQLRVLDGLLLDFEAATTHDIVIEATDQGGLTASSTLTVDVTNVNEPPFSLQLTNAAISENAIDGETIGTLSASDPDLGDELSFTLADDAEGRFSILANELVVGDSRALDFETASDHVIEVRVSDLGGLSSNQTFTIFVLDESNERPDVELSATPVPEDATAGTVIGLLTASDPNPGDQLTIQLMDDAGGRVELVQDELRVSNSAGFDFETAGRHNVVVRVSDDQGLFRDRTFAIDVADVNEPPTGLELSSLQVSENAIDGELVGQLLANDVDADDTHGFELLSNADGRFAIEEDRLVVADSRQIDFEAATQHTIEVRVTDSGGLQFERSFTLSVLDETNERPDLTLSDDVVNENAAAGTLVATVIPSDPNPADVPTVELLDNAAGRFSLDNLDLRVAAGGALDFEVAPDHIIVLRVTDDAGLSRDRTMTIRVADINEPPTDLSLSGTEVSENALAGDMVAAIDVVDPDANESFTYTLFDPTNSFAITDGQVVVASTAHLDFESAPVHPIEIEAVDHGGLTIRKTFSITVLDESSERPTNLSLAPDTVVEGAANGTFVGTLSAFDADPNDTLVFSLVDDADGRFTVQADQLVVSDGLRLDFEAVAQHDVIVRATDRSGLFRDATLPVHVTNVNEAPTAVGLEPNQISEGVPSGTLIGELTGIDPENDPTSFTLLDDLAGRFELIGQELRVGLGTVLDYETADQHLVPVRAIDSNGLAFDTFVTVHVLDVAQEPPGGVTISNPVIPENAPTGSEVGTLNGIDPEGGPLSWSLIDDAGGRFGLDGDRIVVADGSLLDFENGECYTIVVRVTDEAGLSQDVPIKITLQDVNESPTRITLSPSQIREDAGPGAVVGTVTVWDPDHSDTFTLSLVDDAAGTFSLSSNQVQVAAGGHLDYENARHHDIRLRATDESGNAYEETLRILVLDVNEQATDSAGGPYEIDAGRPVLLSAQADSAIHYSWDLNGDGNADVAGETPDVVVSWMTLAGLGLGPGTYPIELTVTDSQQQATWASTTLTVSQRYVYEAPSITPLAATGSSPFELQLAEGQLRVLQGTQTLSYVAAADILHIDLYGSDSDDRFHVVLLNEIVDTRQLSLDGRQGHDTLQLTDSGYVWDATIAGPFHFTNLEALDLANETPQHVTIDPASLFGMGTPDNEFELSIDRQDTWSFPGPWTLQSTLVRRDTFFQVLAEANARLLFDSPFPWSNPLDPLDVIPDGNVVPFDVLAIVNALNKRQFSDATGKLADPRDADPFPHLFLDVDRNGLATPFDMLRIINFLNAPAAAEGEANRVPYSDSQLVGAFLTLGATVDPLPGDRGSLVSVELVTVSQIDPFVYYYDQDGDAVAFSR